MKVRFKKNKRSRKHLKIRFKKNRIRNLREKVFLFMVTAMILCCVAKIIFAENDDFKEIIKTTETTTEIATETTTETSTETSTEVTTTTTTTTITTEMTTEIITVSPQKDDNQTQLKDWEFDLMVEVVNAEAGIEPFEGKIAVAAVILNRRDSDIFPNSIKDVINQPYQFTEPIYSYDDESQMEECRRAVKEALDGYDPSYGALFFYAPEYCSESALAERSNVEVTTIIGGHVFHKNM